MIQNSSIWQLSCALMGCVALTPENSGCKIKLENFSEGLR